MSPRVLGGPESTRGKRGERDITRAAQRPQLAVLLLLLSPLPGTPASQMQLGSHSWLLSTSSGVVLAVTPRGSQDEAARLVSPRGGQEVET